jgi:hypothetical protein
MSRSKPLADFDVITGPPALPASLQKPAEPPRSNTADQPAAAPSAGDLRSPDKR